MSRKKEALTRLQTPLVIGTRVRAVARIWAQLGVFNDEGTDYSDSEVIAGATGSVTSHGPPGVRTVVSWDIQGDDDLTSALTEDQIANLIERI